MNSVPVRSVRQARLYDCYAELFARLLGCEAAFGFYDGKSGFLEFHGCLQEGAVGRWVAGLGRLAPDARKKAHETQLSEHLFAVALMMRDSKGALVGAVVVQLHASAWAKLGSKPAAVVATRLEAGLPMLFREFAAARSSTRTQVLSERTQELEWLFGLTTRLGTNSGDDESIKTLLTAGCERIGAAFGAIVIPEKRVSLTWSAGAADGLDATFARTSGHLLTWVQRREKPLVVNSPPPSAAGVQACRMMALPIIQKAGRVIGLLAFFNPLQAPEFANRHTFLGRHLGRQVAALLETQFDLATGLYTRTALEQQFGRGGNGAADPGGSVIYIDIDRLHLVNETHGFEIGDEVIVRIAELLAPPLIPKSALAARMSGDRFAVVLKDTDPDTAVAITMALQNAASQIRMGTADQKAEISLSCGVAALVDIPQALPRALAAAELACKTAKDRGRGRVEIYATADSSMMRRQDDVIAVGRLRAALKADRMVLYAQKITSLKNPDQACGYEILVRMRDEEGKVISPADFISAAQRYQLLPSIDRWVVERALRQLTPFAGMLLHGKISMSINVSGQSLGDAMFMQRFTEQLAASGVAPGNITVEITEQTAVSNMAHAIGMVRRLRQLGCRIALDDFGTGVNSLAYLKGFPVTRVKIDGSFIRDILTSTRSEETVKAIVQLAKGMEIDTVAEFVEDDLIARKVRSMGIDYAQGYAFGKPEPLEDVLRALQQAEQARPHRFEFDI